MARFFYQRLTRHDPDFVAMKVSQSEEVAAKPQLLVVLGMHRAGTSVVTRALQVMDVELGNNHLQADQNNEKGYWEDIDIQALNAEMLKALDSDWHYLSSISQADVCTLQKLGYDELAANLLNQKVGDSKVFGLKDPRLTKLLPFWNNIFQSWRGEVNYILAIRNPLSIVDSLNKRDELNRAHGFYLCLEYYIMALSQGGQAIRAIVDYDKLMRSPEMELKKLATALTLTFDVDKMEAFETEFLDRDLTHSNRNIDDLLRDQSCPKVVQDIYSSLLDLSAYDNQLNFDNLSDQIESWESNKARLQSLFEYTDHLLRKISIMSAPPTFATSLFNIGRVLFGKLPFSAWLRRKL